MPETALGLQTIVRKWMECETTARNDDGSLKQPPGGIRPVKTVLRLLRGLGSEWALVRDESNQNCLFGGVFQ